MSNKIIRAALESRLQNWATQQGLPVAYENMKFSRPDGVPFLECRLIPNVTMDREVTAKKQRRLGMFQVNVWAPQGVGMGAVESIAEAIVALYPNTPKIFGNLSIEQTPTVRPSFLDEAMWVIVPIIIKYRYET